VRWVPLSLLFVYIVVDVFAAECSELHPCEGLSKHAHFQNFGMAFLTLFRVATGDNWNGIMKVLWFILVTITVSCFSCLRLIKIVS